MTLRDTIERLTKEARVTPMTYDDHLAIVVDALLVWAEEVERRLGPPTGPQPGGDETGGPTTRAEPSA